MAAILIKYEKILIETLREYVEMFNQQHDGMEAKAVIDKENGHYQLLNYGFLKGVYECYIIFHFEIKNNKVWLQENRTDILIAKELTERGIAKNDIVLGLQEPELRAFSGYAVA
jgi:hypothetical protein